MRKTSAEAVDGAMWSSMRAVLESEANLIERHASRLADEFWREHWSRANSGERGYLGVRVRRRGLHIGIEWFRVRFRRTGRGGKLVRQFEYLRRGKALRYPAGVFGSWCRDWERRMALELEEEFWRLRMRIEALSRLARAVRDYDRVAGVDRGVAESETCGSPGSGVGDGDAEGGASHALPG